MTELEEKAAALQSKLDKANRKISINEIHNESYILERDEALNTVSVQRKRIERLEAELADARKGQSSRHADSRKNDAENMYSREQNKAQKSIYYVRRTLHDTETRYVRLEKLIFALIIAVSRLRPYF